VDNIPRIIKETDDFAVVFKPAKMHSTPLKKNDNDNIFDWYKACLGHACNVEIMHRLDFETHGLVLFSRNEKSFNFFKELQDRGEFIKEYSAIVTRNTEFETENFQGFPPCSPCLESKILSAYATCNGVSRAGKKFENIFIESYFRPYGPGRKLVRPVIEDGKKHKEIAKDKGGFYRTEITGVSGTCSEASSNIFTVRIRRGFRHQIRCHLCWTGFPILNDPLYGISQTSDRSLDLRAHALFFADPSTGRQCEFSIKPLLD